MSALGLSRRDWFRLTACGAFGATMSRWLPALAEETAANPARKRACILLWMSGGPSQTDTFDPKPDHENGGGTKAIETSVPGIQIGEHLPKLAKQMQHVAIIRSMSSKEGDHGRATYLMRTGYLPQGPIHYPTMGSLFGKELGTEDAELPNFVSIAPYKFLSPAAFGPGFLGPRYAPLVVGANGGVVNPGDMAYEQSLKVKNVTSPMGVSREQEEARLGLLGELESDFVGRHPGVMASSHRSAYDQAVRMMRSKAMQAFDLSQEPDALRDAYGRNQFGQACLLAKRLVQRGVPFVEVSLNGVSGSQGLGWDSHVNNLDSVKALCGVLDPAWATLIEDLKTNGLLDTTTIVWMGEFGRTPKMNGSKGRDHFPNAWSTVVAGGGIKGGQVYGKTSADGMKVDDNPVDVPDLLATVCKGLGINPRNQNNSDVGRPIRLVDPESEPIQALLT